MTDHDAACWAVQLDGASVDLDEWEQALPDLSDFRMVKVPQGDSLVSALAGPPLEALADASDVRARARLFIEQMNGVMWLAYRALPISLGSTVFRLGPGSSVGVNVFVESGTALRLRGLRAVVTITQPDGTTVSSTPATDPLYRRALSEAESSDAVADLLVQAGRADNWFDLYKAIELAERLAGGEKELRFLMGDQGGAFKNARTTANFFRHAPRNPRPARLYTIEEARDLLAKAVEIVLRRLP